MNDLYSHKLFYQVTEKIYTILKVNVQEQISFLTRRRDFHSYYFDKFTQFF
jgi:hypothetical protein